MADDILSGIIRDHMHALGIEEFHREAIRVYNPADAIVYESAYNEFYFLVARTVPADILIESDTHMFSQQDAASYLNVDVYKIHVFSGMIKMERRFGNVGVDLEFVRVIPISNDIVN